MKKAGIAGGGLLMAAVFVWLSMRWFRGREIGAAFGELVHSPWWILMMTVFYGLSFWMKAVAWRRYVAREKEDRLSGYVYPLFVSLLVNHVLPIKLGDLARTGMLVRMTRMGWEDALHSVAIMRLLDMVSLLLIGSIGATLLGLSVSVSPWIQVALGLGAAGGLLAVSMYIRRMKTEGGKANPLIAVIQRHGERLSTTIGSRRGVGIAVLTLGSWVLEGAVVFGVVHVLHLDVNWLQAVWANSMTIAGQLFHITPGGIGTYEMTLTASLGVLGVAGVDGYTVALLSHGYKFVFAYAFGAVSLVLAAVTLAELKEWVGLRKIGRKNTE
ncbi:lysylphosphatidylglycerol synthase transmembrane domain-containing protein [Paenibacillus montanisoli]|nr:lysylphosphatidylglycerol synthase transmembrane domain-containing protein [Paenibacillus montanisoli]